MTHNPRLKWLSLGACFVIGVALGYIAPELKDSEDAPRTIILIAAGLMLLVVPLSIVWWRSLDELAQEAHKSAFFWGGSTALGAIVVPLLLLVELGRRDSFDMSSLPGNIGYVLGLSAGAGLAIFAVIGGYFIAWLIFWWRKR